jgi:hypothetical protein
MCIRCCIIYVVRFRPGGRWSGPLLVLVVGGGVIVGLLIGGLRVWVLWSGRLVVCGASRDCGVCWWRCTNVLGKLWLKCNAC